MNPEILLFIIKMIAGGIVAFMAILLMSKTRDASWMTLVAGFLLSYIAMVYELLTDLGIFAESSICISGIPVSSLLCTILPSLCFVIAFILKLLKK